MYEKECYEVEVQPYRKTDSKPMLYICDTVGILLCLFLLRIIFIVNAICILCFVYYNYLPTCFLICVFTSKCILFYLSYK